MRFSRVLALLLLASCSPEDPDLVLPLKVPLKLQPETVRQDPRLIQRARQASDADAERMFDRIVELHLQWLEEESKRGSRACGWHDPWLVEAWNSHLLESRLFARAFPELTVRLVLDRLDDADLERGSIKFLLETLQPVGAWANPRLEAILADWVESDRWLSADALLLLSHPSRVKRHRRLFYDACARGDRLAFDLVPNEPESIRFLESLIVSNPGQGDEAKAISFLCGDALYRFRLLESSELRRKIETLLKGNPDSMYYWALDTARARFPNLARAALYRKVVEARAGYAAHLEDPDYVEGFVSKPSVVAVYNLEPLLVDYGRVGGEWTDLEAKRLLAFGFIGDPEEALINILRRRGLW